MINIKNLLTRLKWNYESVDNLSCIRRLLKTLTGVQEILETLQGLQSCQVWRSCLQEEALITDSDKADELFCLEHLLYRVAVVLSVQVTCINFQPRAHVDDHLKL